MRALAGSWTVSIFLPRPLKSIFTWEVPASLETSISLTVAVVPDTLALTWTVPLPPDTGTVTVVPEEEPPPPPPPEEPEPEPPLPFRT